MKKVRMMRKFMKLHVIIETDEIVNLQFCL